MAHIELRIEFAALTGRKRSVNDMRLTEDTEQRPLHPRFAKRAQNVDRVSASAAARIVGHIGKQQGWPR